MTARTNLKNAARPLPADVADVALVAADICAAIGAMSVSWWHEEVRTGRAPKPAIQQPRCTRWRLADVRRFWAEFATRGATADGLRVAARVSAAAAKASRAARVKRAAPAVVIDGGA